MEGGVRGTFSEKSRGAIHTPRRAQGASRGERSAKSLTVAHRTHPHRASDRIGGPAPRQRQVHPTTVRHLGSFDSLRINIGRRRGSLCEGRGGDTLSGEMDDLEAMRLKAIRDAQQRTRMELLASNPAPQPPTDRERDEAHRLLAEQMVQRSLSMQVEALRRREVMKHQLIMQRQAESERAKMEEEEEASVAGGITNGAIADAAVVETGQTDAAQLYENYVPSKVTQGATHRTTSWRRPRCRS